MSVDGDNYVDDVAAVQDSFNNTAHQGCYIFEPTPTAAQPPIERPVKRRKTNKSVNGEGKDAGAFPSLLGGKESPASTQIRRDLFHEFWQHQQQRIASVVQHVDTTFLADIVHFVKETSPDIHCNRIPTGLVLTGLNYSIQGRLLEYWRTNQREQAAEEVIILESSQAPNLTTALKSIIRSVIVQRNGAEWYQSFLSEHKRLIPMNYDLELLQIFVEREGLNKIVISILDVEVFDVNALSDLISALSPWIDRLPIVLLLGIATTVELFEARLPKGIVKLLQARIFDISPKDDSLYNVYQTVQDDPATKLWLGPALSNILLERSKDQDQPPESFAGSIRFIYMSHFFANPLSVLLADDLSGLFPDTQALCNSIRNADSFREHVETLLEAKEVDVVKRVFTSDKHLIDEARTAVTHGQQAMIEYRRAVRLFMDIYKFLQLSPQATLTPFDVDNQAFSGPAFLESNVYNDALASLEKLPSDALESLLRQCPLLDLRSGVSTTEILATLNNLHAINSGAAIRSAQDPKHTTTSATVSRNNTISLAKHAPKLSKLEREYTALLQGVYHAVSDYFESRMIDVNKLFMHEAFVYDLKIPLASVFTPRPRYAIERAIDRPGDYLGCDCCTADGQMLESSNNEKLPPTSLLWQLWCEAGNIVNVRDLWEAFSSTVVDRERGNEDDGDEADSDAQAEIDRRSSGIDERMALALFYRSLAELRMLGFIKSTKKRADCLAKVAWKGL